MPSELHKPKALLFMLLQYQIHLRYHVKPFGHIVLEHLLDKNLYAKVSRQFQQIQFDNTIKQSKCLSHLGQNC